MINWAINKYHDHRKILFLRSILYLFLLLPTLVVTANAQNASSPSLSIGDNAPPLRVRRWIKGTPVQNFEKGTVYVLEFWATWCRPCIEAMPHLSALAHKYKGKVIFLGIDVYEHSISIKQIKAFVDSMGDRMDYAVATEDSNFMESQWFDAAVEKGIPKTFVVNAEGRLAWVGHPKELDNVLGNIVGGTWDMKDALEKRTLNKHLAMLDDSLNFELVRYSGDPNKPGDLGKPDSALLFIAEIIRNVPELKYAPFIAFNTFSSLLKTDQHEAYKYGNEVLATSTYDEPAYEAIIAAIEAISGKLYLSPEIYLLGAQAYQMRINQSPYPALVDIPKLYHKMADWYWHGNKKSKAIDAEQKAIEALKNKRNALSNDKAAYELQLRKYKKDAAE